MKSSGIYLAAILLLAATLAEAQTDGAAEPPQSNPLPMIDVVALIDRLADEMDKEFVLDPRMRAMMPATSARADADYESLLAVLRQNGFAAVETADQILIVPDAFLRIQPSRILQADDRRVSDHEIVTRVIDLRGSGRTDDESGIGLGQQLVPLLRPMMGQNAQLGSVAGGTKLIVVDRYDNVRRITAVIEEIVR